MARIEPDIAARAIREWSKYIDSFESFESEADWIGTDGMARLERHGIVKRYDLHGERARAVAFLLVVDALQEERFDLALFWVACLGHSAADMSAGNHDPLLHLATYDWATIQLDPPDRKLLQSAIAALDLSHTASHSEGREIFVGATNRSRLRDDGGKVRDTLLDIMRYGQEGAAFCVTRGPAVWTAALKYARRDTESTRRALFLPIAELGAWSLVRIARDVEVALRLASLPDRLPDIDVSLMEAHDRQIAEHIDGRRLDDELLFADLLRPLSPAGTGADVGVVIEPTWRMNEGMFGFSDRTLAAMLCRSIDRLGRSRVTLDLREILRCGVPDPAQLTCLVLPARQAGSYHGLRREDLEKRIHDYRKRGGRVLWVGGNQPPLAAPALNRAMRAAEAGQWPIPEALFPGSRLVLSSQPGVGEPENEGFGWIFQRSPETPAGWHRPHGKLHFSSSGEEVIPFLELCSKDGTFLVGAVESISGQGPLLWAPVYALHPYLLTRPAAIGDLEYPRLDAAGEAILAAALIALESAR